MFRSNRFERKGCATLEIMVTRSLRRIYLHIYIHKFVIKSILVDNNASNSIVARAVINSFSWPLVRFEVFFFFFLFSFFFFYWTSTCSFRKDGHEPRKEIHTRVLKAKKHDRKLGLIYARQRLVCTTLFLKKFAFDESDGFFLFLSHAISQMSHGEMEQVKELK